MKKLITLIAVMLFSFTPIFAQQHMTKSGKPDKRYNENKHLTKSGKPDMRYNSSKKGMSKKQ